MLNRKRIGIWGSTGSIGTQALEVIRQFRDRFEIVVLTCGSNAPLLIKQAIEFRPRYVVIGDATRYSEVIALAPLGIQVLAGKAALTEIADSDEYDLMLAALVGAAGLEPTLAAIAAGKDIALANKETLVVAGELVMSMVKKHGVRLLPVDSEHSAIFQALRGSQTSQVDKIILTASGGPFLGKQRDQLTDILPEQALKHPNWTMGAKISIDSATMMNKGLEVIEAKWLFGLNLAQIDVVVHPQSILHSLVQFVDGSLLAQMGLPDMKLPIQYAFSYPERWPNDFKRFDFAQYPSLTFQKPDTEVFRALALAFHASEKGGNMPAILNAANEVAVQAFLEKKLGFLQIAALVEETMRQVAFSNDATLETYTQSDLEARRKANELLHSNINHILA